MYSNRVFRIGQFKWRAYSSPVQLRQPLIYISRLHTRAASVEARVSPRETEERLNQILSEGKEFLAQIKAPLEHMQRIGLLGAQGENALKGVVAAERADFSATAVLAFVGDSGVGKSKLLTAVLDEPNILPTSGLHACTSFPIEIRQREIGKEGYRVETEFLQQGELETEMRAIIMTRVELIQLYPLTNLLPRLRTPRRSRWLKSKPSSLIYPTMQMFRGELTNCTSQTKI
ncbi:hypothetical protein TWF506_008823 [Arthrobotrys conoides]|uniref:Uncharacterized protein n=1 Tax=Arthrobotrys conoides TaxID=74498 RepID=A0AAN8RMZ7_9PEZI